MNPEHIDPDELGMAPEGYGFGLQSIDMGSNTSIAVLALAEYKKRLPTMLPEISRFLEDYIAFLEKFISEEVAGINYSHLGACLQLRSGEAVLLSAYGLEKPAPDMQDGGVGIQAIGKHKRVKPNVESGGFFNASGPQVKKKNQ